jgi:hypothetical protein
MKREKHHRPHGRHSWVDCRDVIGAYDRVMANPPFSEKVWGYDIWENGDPFGRDVYGCPPKGYGDLAFVQHGGQDGMSVAQPRRSSFDIARHTGKLVDVTRSIGGVLRATAMPEIAVPFPLRCATAGTVHPAYTIALHRRRSAGQASAL